MSAMWFVFAGTAGTAFGVIVSGLCRTAAIGTAMEEVARLQNTVVALTHGLDFKDLQLKARDRQLMQLGVRSLRAVGCSGAVGDEGAEQPYLYGAS